MSGQFAPAQHNRIESTDDPDLARNFGLTEFNRETGLYTAPKAPDAGQRDGADVEAERHAAAKVEGDEADKAMRDKLAAAQADADKTTATKPATKATGSKTSQSKADDAKDSKDDDKK
jgi:hypothetical protein